jgi:hypothetical protein
VTSRDPAEFALDFLRPKREYKGRKFMMFLQHLAAKSRNFAAFLFLKGIWFTSGREAVW